MFSAGLAESPMVDPMSQNTSHAVMAQRVEPGDSLDDFPTPPWASRALIEHVIGAANAASLHCLEPACGRGHMAAVMTEYFARVTASDVAFYGYAPPRDFLSYGADEQFDWIITNPPFRLAENFVLHALERARVGVALLVRTVFIESVGRLERVFSQYPPTYVAQFSERVPMVKGRLDKKASTATGYAWVIWEKPLPDHTRLVWIPRTRKVLERDADYTAEFIRTAPPARTTVAPVLTSGQADLFDAGGNESDLRRGEAAR
jgi:hypothetical protein